MGDEMWGTSGERVVGLQYGLRVMQASRRSEKEERRGEPWRRRNAWRRGSFYLSGKTLGSEGAFRACTDNEKPQYPHLHTTPTNSETPYTHTDSP